MTTLMTIILQGAGASAAGGSGFGFWIMIIAMFAIMYFFMIRPQQKKQKEIERFRKSLSVGQSVITAGGVHGTIRQIDEITNIVVVEIAKDVKVSIDRACIFADAASAQQKSEQK